MNNKIKHLIINNRNLIVFIHDLIVIALANTFATLIPITASEDTGLELAFVNKAVVDVPI